MNNFSGELPSTVLASLLTALAFAAMRGDRMALRILQIIFGRER